MADKYVDVSLSTGLNDGTSQANAWQSLTDVFKNTMASGSLAEGDVVHVRTADSSGDLSEYITADVSCATVGTQFNPVKFIFDPGVKWTEKGVFEYGTITDVAHQLNFQKNGYIDAFTDGVRRFRFITGFVDASYYNISAQLKGFIRGVIFDLGSISYTTNYMQARDTEEVGVTLVDCYIYSGRLAYSSTPYLIGINDVAGLMMINCTIDMQYTATSDISTVARLFFPAGDAPGLVVYGGKVVNGKAGCGVLGPASTEQNVAIPHFYGFDRGPLKAIQGSVAQENGTTATSGNRINNQALFIGGKHPFDFYHYQFGSHTDFEEDASWPYLNTTLPDSASQGFSVRYLPPGDGYGSELITFHCMHTLHKVYTQSAAVRDITVELLIDSSYGSPDKNKLFAIVQYENSSGEQVQLSSFDQSGTVATSTASWFNNTYIGRTWNPHKIEFTTPDAIAQDTTFTVTVFCSLRRTNDTAFMFVDPDPVTT